MRVFVAVSALTLAVPYQWWGFQHRQMIGLFFSALSGLPIEEVCVWIAVTYGTAIVFEVLKTLLASERSITDTLMGISRTVTSNANVSHVG